LLGDGKPTCLLTFVCKFRTSRVSLRFLWPNGPGFPRTDADTVIVTDLPRTWVHTESTPSTHPWGLEEIALVTVHRVTIRVPQGKVVQLGVSEYFFYIDTAPLGAWTPRCS